MIKLNNYLFCYFGIWFWKLDLENFRRFFFFRYISDDTFLKDAVFCEHHAMPRYLVISIFGTELLRIKAFVNPKAEIPSGPVK